MKLIVNQGPHGLMPQAVVNDAPAVKTDGIKLSEPPQYTLGDKVLALSAIVHIVGCSLMVSVKV